MPAAPEDLTIRAVVREDLTPEAPGPAPPAEPAEWTGDDVVRVQHVAKRFGPVVALRDVNLRLGRGEALGLVGDNASGKTTLIKLLCGLLTPDAGGISVWGSPVALDGVGHARGLGIECVFQDLALVDQMSVWQNIFLRRERVRRPLPFLDRRGMRAAARRLLAGLGLEVASMDVPVGRLSGGERQAVAVARCVISDVRILLLDEPLAALGAKPSALILNAIDRLRERSDVSIVMVGHNHAQVLDVCDRVNLLEDGRIALDKPTSEVSLDELVRPLRSRPQTR